MIGCGCGWGMFYSRCQCKGGIFSRDKGMRTEVGIDEDLVEIKMSAEIDNVGAFHETVDNVV